MDATPRLALPLLVPGQAQKEMTHNEALARLDATVQASVTSVGRNAPPSAPEEGECWIVGTAPSGAWAGAARSIAVWTAGGWRFVAPHDGMAVWSRSDGLTARFAGGEWQLGKISAASVFIGGVQVLGPRAAAIAAPSGGSVIDVQARARLVDILDVLRNHGLIAG